MFIIKTLKNICIHIRSSFKFLILIIASTVLIIGIIAFFYKPMYSVTLNGEFIGYTQNRSNLQEKINKYIIGGAQNIAFIDVSTLPEYSLCFMRRTTQSNDDDIFSKVTNTGITYYEYFAIVENNEEKYYVSTKEEAEAAINELKDKNSNNIDKIAYTQVYGTELKDFAEQSAIVDALYEKKTVTYTVAYATGVSSPTTQLDLSQYGVYLAKPVSGIITSRYGARSGSTHKGLDIATNYGTPIKAAASGTVTYVNYSNVSYGNCVKISHGNGVETLYAHCSSIYVTVGQTVAQGETIAAVGSTGNSTGNHLHFEIRVDGTTYNPQNYLY